MAIASPSPVESSHSPTVAVTDLQSALDVLRTSPGQLLETEVEVDPRLELAGVYARVGGGVPVKPPTQIGPALLFSKPKGYTIPVLAGLMASRKRTALICGSTPDRLAFDVLSALERPLPPVLVDSSQAPCQEVIYRPPLDLLKLLPIPTATSEDAGPYFTLGVVRAEDPETGHADITIHRLCVQGPDLLTIYFAPDRHIDVFRQKAEKMGKPLPVSVNVGLDPAILLTVSFEEPTAPLGFDELTIAGGFRQRPIELVACVSQPAKAIARAEIVLEGEILPHQRMAEDAATHKGLSMPEMSGYVGKAAQAVPLLRVTAITHRRNAIFQTLVGPGEEQVNLNGIPTEASILYWAQKSMPGFLQNVYAAPAGAGKWMVILQCKKASAADDGRPRQAALAAMAASPETKQVILVDEDVNLFDANDVLWALCTRYQGDVDTIHIPVVRGEPLDLSQAPEYNPLLRPGLTAKTIFDCTVPFALRDRFRRSPFEPMDIGRFLPQGFTTREGKLF